jgi:polyribonucleotide nucleotidyltransferase
MNAITKKFTLADGREIQIETGKLAKQSDGAVVVKMGDTMLLATVVGRQEAGENVDFMPLTVEYREKYAAAGRFPGGFFKRETRPSDYEVLISRLVDRAIRPLFPDDYHAEVQVIITLISRRPENAPRCTRLPGRLIRTVGQRHPIQRADLRGQGCKGQRRIHH